MVSACSCLSAILVFNAFIVLICFLRHSTAFLAGYSVFALVLLTGLCLLRVALPFELSGAYVVRSAAVLPFIGRLIRFPFPSGRVRLTFGEALLVLWAAGVVLFAVRDIAQQRRFHSECARFRHWDSGRVRLLASALNIKHTIFVTPDISIPFVTGVRRPVIFIPAFDYSDDDLSYILEHEAQHLRNLDPYIKLLFCVVKDVFWWNPASHILFRELGAILELRCDARLTDKASQAERCGYLAALFTAVRYSMDAPPKCACASAFVKGTNNMKQRFEVIVAHGSRKSVFSRCLVYLMIFLAFLSSYFVLLQPAPCHESDSAEISCLELLADEGLPVEAGGEGLPHSDPPAPAAALPAVRCDCPYCAVLTMQSCTV